MRLAFLMPAVMVLVSPALAEWQVRTYTDPMTDRVAPNSATRSTFTVRRLAQRDLQLAQVNGGFNAPSPPQFQNDALPVLQSYYSWPALHRCDGRIDTVNGCRSPHVIGAAYQIHSWRPKGANADPTDAQRIALALEVQGAAAPAYNESGPVNDDTD